MMGEWSGFVAFTASLVGVVCIIGSHAFVSYVLGPGFDAHGSIIIDRVGSLYMARVTFFRVRREFVYDDDKEEWIDSRSGTHAPKVLRKRLDGLRRAAHLLNRMNVEVIGALPSGKVKDLATLEAEDWLARFDEHADALKREAEVVKRERGKAWPAPPPSLVRGSVEFLNPEPDGSAERPHGAFTRVEPDGRGGHTLVRGRRNT